MKNRVIRERYAALVALSQRVLPSPSAVNKVSALLATKFRRPYDGTEEGRKKVIADWPVPEGWERDTLPLDVAEARQRGVEELMEQDTPVGKISPRLLLTEADLPKPLKREDGESNVAALAEIIVMLGSLYVLSEAEMKLRADDADEGEEPA